MLRVPQATKPGAKDTRPTDRISQVDTTLGGNAKTLASNITYLPFGDITGLTYGNNISLTRNHDTQYRVTSITAGSVLNLTYGHDAAGNVTTLTDAYNTPSVALLENPADYFYDGSSDKLVHINASPSTDFGYDANGNITAETNRTYVYDLRTNSSRFPASPSIRTTVQASG